MGLRDKLEGGEFVVLVELEPPKGSDAASFLNGALAVKGRVDALVVPEMANAVMKMSALGGSILFCDYHVEWAESVWKDHWPADLEVPPRDDPDWFPYPPN